MNTPTAGKKLNYFLTLSRFAFCLTLCLFSPLAHAQLAIDNIQATQRPGTELVDIDYDLTGDAGAVTVSLEITSDGGASWLVPATSLTGSIGPSVTPGTSLRITWNAGADWDNQTTTQCRFRITADRSQSPPQSEAFTFIPAGNFQMGDTFNDEFPSEKPVHNVNVSSFQMGKHEVTKALWDEVRIWGASNGYTDLPVGGGKAANHPVQSITWYSMLKWCNARSEKEGLPSCYRVSGAVYKTGTSVPDCDWLASGYRLPSEAEWEKAARGGLNGKRFPWGDTINHDNANYQGNSSAYPYDTSSYTSNTYHPVYNDGVMPYSSPVGSFPANGYGLYDMSGNIWEICWDWHSDGYYTTSPATDPRGPATGTSKVARGGGWNLYATGCRSARRFMQNPTSSINSLGFRLARSSITITNGVSAQITVDTRQGVILTINPMANGTISGSVTGGNYPIGSTVVLSANPDPGYSFGLWTGDATGTTNPLSLLMDSNKTIGASFDPDLADADSDGMSNWWEVVNSLNPNVNDAGNDAETDGVTNYEEFQLSFNPRSSDSDGDGVQDRAEDSDGDKLPDVWELRLGLNRSLPDTNGNGVLDADEDSDGDGLTNDWDLTLNLSPLLQDSDGDGITDAMEDADGDGLPNGWEVRFGLNPLVSDKNQTGDGSDGPLNVPTGTTHVLAPWSTTVSGSNPTGALTVGVTDGSGFAANDLVLLWIAQHAEPVLTSNTSGKYQICRVLSTSANSLILLNPLNTDFSAVLGKTIVAQKIPEYSTASVNGILEPVAWNGTKGGILVFCARSLTIASSGKIHADGKGFRGGANYALADVDGLQGESYLAGYGARSVTASGGGGGGGGRSYYSSGNGGGGGGHATTGGAGGFWPTNPLDRPSSLVGGAGGALYGSPSIESFMLGSGGGTGGQDGNDPGDDTMAGGFGGNGGGMLLLISSQILNSGTISSNGDNGANGLSTERGGGGAGSGGSIYIVGNYTGSGNLRALGGMGGTGQLAEISGGTGGAGRIRCDAQAGAQAPISDPAVGFQGTFADALQSTGLSLESYRDADLDGLDTLQESSANTDPFKSDTDNDGMPDGWEVENGTNPLLADATTDTDADGLDNFQELQLGTKANMFDTDADGLSDGVESDSSGTNPLSADTDGDGMPDQWEVDHGLDPRRDDRNEDRDLDFLTNWEEFEAGLDPASVDSDSNGTPDFQQLRGKTSWDALYDRNDRLLGVRHERGASFGYQYDGNSNLVRQVKLGRDGDNDGLSDLWEFANGLDPKSADSANGLTGDLDGDGWTNFQEYVANSNPSSATDKPGIHGKVLPAIPFPFTPSRFVIGTGQLDNAGSEEIVVSADGDPLGGNNFLRLYREGDDGWVHEDIQVGDYGVTSVTIGSVAGRQGAIYAGLRKAGGQGRVVELMRTGATWQTNVVSESLSAESWVHGIRSTTSGTDLPLGLFTRFGPDGALYRAVSDGGVWKVVLLETGISHRGQGTIFGTSIGADQILRAMDTGGIQQSAKKDYPSLDEFNDTVIDPNFWTSSGSSASGGSWTSSESGGNLNLQSAWTSTSSSSASAVVECASPWIAQGGGLLIRIGQASHNSGGSTAAGSARVELGTTVLYSVGPRATAQNIMIQIFQQVGLVFYRTKVDTGAWGGWTSTSAISPLRFVVSGSRGSNTSGSGNASMQVDYVRMASTGEIIATASSPVDFSAADAAYHAASNTWFFRNGALQTWTSAQLDSWAQGGRLVTVDSSSLNTWLQGKFSGEYWTGFYRNSVASPWRWVGNSTGSFTNWAAGQPSTDESQAYGFSNSGQWSSATVVQTKARVFEIKGPVAEVTPKVVAEHSAANRLLWAGRSLTGGRFYPATQNQSSLIQAFVDDKDASGGASAGDEFVIGETILGDPATVRTVVRRPMTTPNGAGFGVTALRTRSGSSDMLATAEPDGQVCVWIPATAGGLLQRKVLSLENAGMGWNGLERFVMAGGAQAMAGLRVNAVEPGTVSLVIWDGNDLDFVVPPVLQQSPPSARLLTSPSEGGSIAPLAARIWDSEGNKAALSIQFKDPVSGLWRNAGIQLINGGPPPLGFSLVSGPAGVTHSVLWSAGSDLGQDFRGSVLMRAQATDNGGSGEWSSPLAYTISGPADSDQDGMPDTWESANSLNPSLADASGDLDSDGVKNLVEFAFGMNPKISDLHLLPKLTIEGGYAILTVDRNADAAGLLFAAEKSVGMSTVWESGTSVFTVMEDTPSRLRVRMNQPVTVDPVGFVRLKVSKP